MSDITGPAVHSSQIPNFFVVGAPKAGTTSLYRYLRQHPAIWMSPIKEPSFFAPEVVDFTARSRRRYEADAAGLRAYLAGPMTTLRSHGFTLEWEQYLKLFRDAGGATARGDASGNYLPSATAPAAIRQRIPDARIVMILRDPADRLFSQYASAVAVGNAHGSFDEWITQQQRAESARSPRYGPIWTGMYAQHLSRWRAVFPADRIHVILYEDYRDRVDAVLSDVFAFLGVDPTMRAGTAKRYNVTMVPRWPRLDARMTAIKPLLRAALPQSLRVRARAWYRRPSEQHATQADRARLISVYGDEVRELADLLGRDLSAWTREEVN